MGGESKFISQLSIGKLFVAILIIVAIWLLLKWIARFFLRLQTHNPRMRFLANQLQPPLRIFLWFSALLLVVDILAPSRDAFLAVLGSAALAIGLGLQDLIKNLVGGLVIVADAPFQTSDRVKIGDAYGEVVHIGLRSTKILTSDGRLAAIPNSEILTQQTFNANRSVPESMVTTDINLPRGIEPDVMLRIGREVAISCPFTHLGRTVSVALEDKDPRLSSVRLSIEAYVYDHRYEPDMQTDICVVRIGSLNHVRRRRIPIVGRSQTSSERRLSLPALS
jgi:small-conductance mechanosensitive channel